MVARSTPPENSGPWPTRGLLAGNLLCSLHRERTVLGHGSLCPTKQRSLSLQMNTLLIKVLLNGEKNKISFCREEILENYCNGYVLNLIVQTQYLVE